jgi:hypothetical protein
MRRDGRARRVAVPAGSLRSASLPAGDEPPAIPARHGEHEPSHADLAIEASDVRRHRHAFTAVARIFNAIQVERFDNAIGPRIQGFG